MEWLRHWWHRILAGAFYLIWMVDRFLPSWVTGQFDEWAYSILFGALTVQIELYKSERNSRNATV